MSADSELVLDCTAPQLQSDMHFVNLKCTNITAVLVKMPIAIYKLPITMEEELKKKLLRAESVSC